MQRGLPSWTHGPLLEAGGVRFRLWAPGEERVSVVLESEGRSVPMRRGAAGFFEAFVADARAGTLYRFELLDGKRVPDPASRFQPHDVHGPSEIVDHAAYRWRDDWPGRDWDDIVLYELHLGAFTAGGTFKAAIEKLDPLAELGVTALEIMPLSDFPGRRSWGYDGVYSYAPDASYGRPEDFKAFVEAAHAPRYRRAARRRLQPFRARRELSRRLRAGLFHSRHRTPWGDAINYDGANAAPVRAFVIENAEYWIETFHLDGLRLDAVDTIKDDSLPDILDELAQRAGRGFPDPSISCWRTGRTRRAGSSGAPGSRFYTAQWNDDLHHVLHVAATREQGGYYAD